MTSANKINDKLDTILKLRADIKKMLNELDSSTELVNPDTGDKMLRDDAIKVAEDVINKVQNDINEITNNGKNIKNIFNNQFYVNDLMQDKQITKELDSNNNLT